MRQTEQQLYEEAAELRHELHRHPELSLHEKHTKERLMEYLRVHTSLTLHDMGNWFYAVYEGKDNTEAASSSAPADHLTAGCGPAQESHAAGNEETDTCTCGGGNGDGGATADPVRSKKTDGYDGYSCGGGRGDGGAIAFRADMDALPIEETLSLPYASETEGVSHKCGHDGHSAALCLFAQLLEHHCCGDSGCGSSGRDSSGRDDSGCDSSGSGSSGRDGSGCDSSGSGSSGRDNSGERYFRPGRKVYLVFQPAEEIGKGGAVCADFLAREGVSEVYAFHNLPGFPVGSIVVREGLSQPASEGLSVRFLGEESHASNPEEGRNPALAVAELICCVNEYLADRTGQSRTGGTAALAAETENEAGHAESREEQEEHEKAEAEQADEEAAGNGSSMVLATVVGVRVGNGDFGISPGTGELDLTLRAENERDMKDLEQLLTQKARVLAQRDGLEVSFEICDYFPETRNDPAALNRVMEAAAQCGYPVIKMPKLWRASEDFGYYTKKMRGAVFYIGAGERHAPLHTKEYDFEDRILPVAARMFLALAGAGQQL